MSQNSGLCAPAAPLASALAALALLVLGILSAGSAMAGGPPQPDPATRITDRAEMEKLLIDQTFYGNYAGNGEPWAEYQSRDGRTAYLQGDCIYAGHWWIRVDLVCYRYDSFNDGQAACFGMFERNGQLEFYMRDFDGTWVLNAYTTRRRPGNPDKMPLDGEACVGV